MFTMSNKFFNVNFAKSYQQYSKVVHLSEIHHF